jgi:hypothetical protein
VKAWEIISFHGILYVFTKTVIFLGFNKNIALVYQASYLSTGTSSLIHNV